MRRGETYLALGEYHDAAREFRAAYQKTPPKERNQRGERALKMAACYEKINEASRAVSAYRNALRYGKGNMNTRLALARQLLKTGDYKAAATEFQMVADSMPDDALARNGLYSAQHAPQWKKDGSRYRVRRMDLFNSRRDDYSPMLLGDDYDQLYFTSTRSDAVGNELSGITGMKPGDIFYSRKDDQGKWSRPEVV